MGLHSSLGFAALAGLAGITTPAVIELDPTNVEDQATLVQKMTDCSFDKIVDVRSEFYYDNWRITGGSHHPFTGSSLHNLDEATLIAENVTSIAFYCWVAPFQSEPASVWFDATYGHLNIDVYDIKGLSYLDDIPGFCPFLTATPEAIEVLSPHCDGLTGSHECPTTEDEQTEPDYTETVDDATLDVLVNAVGLDAQQATALEAEDQTETDTQTAVDLEVTIVVDYTEGEQQEDEHLHEAVPEVTSQETPNNYDWTAAIVLSLLLASALIIGWTMSKQSKGKQRAEQWTSQSAVLPATTARPNEKATKGNDDDVEQFDNPLPPEVLMTTFDVEELKTVTEI